MKTFKNSLLNYKFIKMIFKFIIHIKNIFNNKAFTFSFIALLFKTLLFIFIISSSTATKINIKTVFYSVPPILVYFSFILIFLSFSYIFEGKYHLLCLFILNIILTIIILGDVIYYRANSSFLSLHLLKYTSNLENLSDSIFSMFRWIDILFFIDTVMFAAYIFKIKASYIEFKRSFSKFLILLLIPSVYLGYAHIKVDILGKSFLNQTLFVNSWSQNQTMSNLTPLGYHMFDIYNYFIDTKPYKLSEEEKENLNLFLKTKNETHPDNKYKGIFKGKNLIILQVESLENFVISKTINEQEITPNINKLLENSIYFNNFLEQTNEGTTSDAEFMCNTSILPVKRGSTFFRFPSNTYRHSLPNIMKENGYSTLAVHPDHGSYWNWLPALKSIGFDKCIDSTNLKLDDTIGLGLSDKSFLPQLVDIIEKEPKPFYTFSITLTSHTPYNIPRDKVSINLPNNLKETEMGSYFEAINYTDSSIGEFLKLLDDKKLLDDSVIVIYGDHEGVHKYFSDEINSLDVEPWMKNNNFKVPFIIYSKDLKPESLPTAGGEIDILPTVAYLMGIDSNKCTYTMGRNLLNTNLNYTYDPSGKLYNYKMPYSITSILEKAPEYSDIIIRSNYFRKE